MDYISLNNQIVKKRYPVYWLLDSSGSMKGASIQSLNYIVATINAALFEISSSNPTLDFYIRTMKMSDDPIWLEDKLIRLKNYMHTDVTAGGFSCLGAGLTLLKKHFDDIELAKVKICAPAVILISDGRSTDNTKKPLSEMLSSKYGAVSTKIAISIGQSCDKRLLRRFINNPELKILEITDNIQQVIIEQITLASSKVVV